MRKVWDILRKNVLWSSLINILVVILVYFLLKIFNITFRQWVYYFVFSITVIGIIIGSVQIAKRRGKKTKALFIFLGIVIAIIIVMFWKIILLVFAFSYKPEHIVTKDNKKYVAYVIAFKQVEVEYYDYINFFLVGNRLKLREEFGRGGYDPFDGEHNDKKVLRYYYYDNNNNVINTNDELYNKLKSRDSKTNTIEESNDNLSEVTETSTIKKDIIYEKRINDKIVIRVINKGDILAQRSIIGIEKTVNNGETWNEQLETSDGVIQIHNGAKFVFINENIGFINDPGLAGTNGENSGLLVTTNGGKSFSDVIFKNSMQGFHIEDLPYLENNMLKLKVYKIENYEKKYYYLYSEDNGKTWDC